MSERAWIGITAGCAWLVLACAPAAQAQLLAPAPRIGVDRGVTIERAGRTLVVSFKQGAARRYRYIAGREVAVECTKLPRNSPSLEISDGFSVIRPAPRTRRRFRLPGIPSGRIDYCEVRAPSRTVRRNGRKVRTEELELASVALTSEGVKFLDERNRAVILFAVFLLAGLQAEQAGKQTYPTIQEFVPRSRGAAVGLDSPQATPPAGRVGYWSDGTEHAAVVVLSSSGRRLYIEVDADDRISTNVAGYLPFWPT